MFSLKRLAMPCLFLAWITALIAFLDGLEIFPDVIRLQLWGTDDIASIILWVSLTGMLVGTSIALGVNADKK